MVVIGTILIGEKAFFVLTFAVNLVLKKVLE